MVAAAERYLSVGVLAGALLVGGTASGQGDGGKDAHREAVASVPSDEIIVHGRLGDLRLQLTLAENAVFDRFNEINSDDRFDIHCRMEAPLGTHIPHRVCEANFWREQDANYAGATIAELRGESGPPPDMFRGEQSRMQNQLAGEMRRLAAEDPQLRDAVLRLGSAQQAIGLYRPGETLDTEVPAGADGLPYDARRMFEVRVGRDPWRHPLTQHTFTIAQVEGEVRDLSVQCEHGKKQITYESGVDWTVPEAWGSCSLRVNAKRDTTFVLYEFASGAAADSGSHE